MAAQVNGRPKKAKKSTLNGIANSGSNGPSSTMNGHTDKTQQLSNPSTRTSAARRPKRTFFGALASLFARLTTWYLIVTFLFRCPSSLTQIDASSPRVCKPYLQTRVYVAPYLDPYYETYVVPQLDKIRPYTDRFEKQVYTPLSAFTKDQYATHGAHRVDQAKKYAEAQYDKSVRPQILLVQAKGKEQYDQYLGHHVKTATDAVAPYYTQIKASLDEIYHLTILPAYEASLPYLRRAHAEGHHMLVHIVFPHINSAKDATWSFFLRTIWPQLRVLYGDNVEPQLVRIFERLGRYRDQKKVESVMDSLHSHSSSAAESKKTVPTLASSVAPLSSASAAVKSGWDAVEEFFGGDASSTAPTVQEHTSAVEPADVKLTGAELQEKLNEDLRNWQNKFATAADKGAEDLEQRVEEITKRQVDNAVRGHGKALVVKLEETADSTISKLKNFIKKTVTSIPEDASEADLEAAFAECGAKTRAYGLNVKEKAQDIRAWKASYDLETDNLVQAAVASTVEVLEKIHGLGLQEVGMRWAWTDGVTYQDWQNYHKLRDTLNEWQSEVEAVGSRHEGLRIAHEEAKKLEDEAMTIASNMVSELVRLKEVSKWKIWAGDSSDDFSDREVPPRIFNAAQKIVNKVESASSQVSEAVQGSSTPLSESISLSVQSVISEVSSHATETVQSSSPLLSESVASVAGEVSSQASSPVSDAGQAVLSPESLLVEASSKVAEVVADGASQASAAYESPKKVFGGANAQIIAEAKQIIFDEPLDDEEDDSYSHKIQGVVADAGEQAAELSRVVSEALLGPSKTQGSVESVSSLASEQYASALAAASSVLYGTKQPVVASATSLASDKFAQAVTAASYAIYGTPTPTAIIKTIRTEASSRYNDAVRLASQQLENARSQMSLLVSGAPQPAHQTLLSYIEQAYSDSVAAASDRLAAALQYTESVKSYAAGPTQGYFESVSSIASARLADGISQASVQFAPKSTGVVDEVVDNTRRQYYEAVGLAHVRYSEFLDAASSAVYGPQQGTIESLASVASASAASAASIVSESAESVASNISGSAQSAVVGAQAAADSLVSQVSSGLIGSETPWTESVASQASRNWEALIAKASSQVYGKPTPWAESLYSQAGAFGAQATAAAAQQYADVQALISELVIGKEPDFTESVMNRFASVYSTALPAVASSLQSYASDSFESANALVGEGYGTVTSIAADAYASASSVVSAVFTPPPAVEQYLSQASASIDLAVESASIALYGTPKGAAERASESVVSAYSSMQSQISEKVYGTKQAQDSFSSVAISAQAAISAAIFGTPTVADYVASATSGAGNIYSSISSAASANAEYVASVAGENAGYVACLASSVVYGPEQGAMESANSRIAAAVAVANSKISKMYAAASVNAQDAASSVVSAATEATARVKDEL